MTTEKKLLTVKMSEQSPLKVDPEIWPKIAEAHWFNGQHEFQANYVRRIFVREHEDGRRLVYGFYTSGDGGAPLGFRGARGGFLIEAGGSTEQETIRAIRRVAGIIGDDALGDECVADLPAQDLV